MAEAQLFLNPLLVRVYGFRADEQPLANLRCRIALRHQLKDVALALSELPKAFALGLRRILLDEIPRQKAGRTYKSP